MPTLHALGAGDDAVGPRHAVDEMNVLCQKVEQAQIVLDHHDRLFLGQRLQYARHVDALIDIEVGADLIEEVEVRISRHSSRNGHALQLSSA